VLKQNRTTRITTIPKTLEHSPGFQNMIASEGTIHYVSYIWNSGRNLEF